MKCPFDIVVCSVWSGSTLFAQACLSKYLGQMQYPELELNTSSDVNMDEWTDWKSKSHLLLT